MKRPLHMRKKGYLFGHKMLLSISLCEAKWGSSQNIGLRGYVAILISLSDLVWQDINTILQFHLFA